MKRMNSFLIFCSVVVILIFFIFGIKIITKETEASFGGVTGSFGNGTKVTYYSNYPDDEIESKFYEYEGANSYKILSNMFDVPDGYEFLGWGVYSSGPVLYNENQYINVTFDINLYAIWSEVFENKLMYGDANLDGIINMSDGKLIDDYILDNSILTGQGLENADVNVDGKIDNIDSDIVKQVCLGTEGYVGFLPDKPVLIYELYVNENTNEGNNTGDNKPSLGGGSGTSGNGSGASNSSGGKPNNSSNNNVNKKPSANKEEILKEDKKYSFKFMNEDMEYAKTECLVLEDKTCMLVLPNTIPAKESYKFVGWSIEIDCSKDIVKDSIRVSSDNTYYACFSKINEIPNEKKENSMTEWILVILIWFLAVFGIYKVVDNFKNTSN